MPARAVESVFGHWEPLTQTDYNMLVLDFEKFCEEGSMITNKNGQPVKFKLNEAQKQVAKSILVPVFAIVPTPTSVFIHKCRQMGISVVLGKIEQYICSRMPNTNTQHIMPTEPDADDFCDKKVVPLLQGCLLGDAEVMTKSGWIKFDDYNGEDILIGDGINSWFEKPSEVVHYDNDEGLVEYSGRSYYHLSTRGHRMVFKRKDKVIVREAWEGIPQDSSNNTFITTTKIDGAGLSLDDDYLRLAIAIQADAHYDKDSQGITFQLGKHRKIQRIESILNNLNIKYSKVILNGANKGQVNIRLLAGHGVAKYKKLPFEWIYQSSLRQKEVMIRELGRWDGYFCKDRNSIEYYSSDEYCAAWVDTLCHASGIHSNLSTKRPVGNRITSYKVNIPLDAARVTTQQAHRKEVPYSGKVHCVTVSSTMFWCRINGKISLTGNTHPDLLPEVKVLKRRLKFDNLDGTKLDSYIDFTSSETRSGGRSRTNQVVIEDEQAHYQNVSFLERGVLATLPRIGRSLRVVVSTAYGINHFYDLSKVAKDSEHWDYMFLPWHMLEEYEREPTGRLKKLESLSPYEVKLCGIFEEEGYPVEKWARKLAWWTYTFETEAKLDMDYMYENYPSLAEESFAASGAPVLPAQALKKFRDNPLPFTYVEATEDNRGNKTIKQTELSTMKMYYPPEPRRKYALAIDPSDGGADGDYSSLVVIDTQSMREVLTMQDKLEQNEVAELADIIGRYYNRAQIIVERNTGQTVIDWLVMLKYPSMYVDPVRSSKVRVVYGVYMTWPAKKEAITRMKFLLNSGNYHTTDQDFIDQGMHFVWKKTPSGLQKAIGTDGYADDAIMSRLNLVYTLNMNRFRGYNNS